MAKSLTAVVAEKPFQEFAEWWTMGNVFVSFMSDAIYDQWQSLAGNSCGLSVIREYVAEYVDTVFHRTARFSVVDRFITQPCGVSPIASGEFDALSYAFYRSAFEQIAAHAHQYESSVERERQLFTKRVGTGFFSSLDRHLSLDLPSGLHSHRDLERVEHAIEQIGGFLKAQGYLRTHFAFRLDVDIEYAGRAIVQARSDFLNELRNNGTAHALTRWVIR